MDISLTLSQTLTGATAGKPSSTQQRKILALLDQVSFSHEPVVPPNWQYFVPAKVEEVIRACEEPGPARQVDIKQLNGVLNAELAVLHGTAALSQHHYVVQEIKSVLEYCVERNCHARWLRTSSDCVEAWRQVLEVLLTAVPASLLTDHPDQVIMDMSRHILNKTLDPASLSQLTSPLADPGRRAKQRTRVNLYGALLHLLSAAAGGPDLTDACREYGRPLVETVCRDACGGHDVCRMLAMACLDALLRMDRLWLSHLSGHGYLAALAESLQADDAPLRALLVPQPADLRPLYLYESKMSLLCRVALVPDGARLLLQTRLMARLSDLGAVDCWPARAAPDGVRERYRLVAQPALRLCVSLLASLGREDQSAAAQVNHFLLSHMDMVTSLLRHQPDKLDADNLEDLVLLTAVLSQTSHEDQYGDVSGSQLPERRGQLSRLQLLTLTQLPRFVQLLAELAGDDQLPLGERRQRAHQYLGSLRTLVGQQVELSRHVLELALDLLWTHLDVYLLKRELPQAVTDTLLGQVEAALQHPLVGRSHYSFSEAMVRRLRRVTRLHTGA
ncbi:nuclear pore complex protein Nup205-like [Pollicipes pollicipes]|uniref:nuclear pore complex protein Nup205-like n=1 Tax=Pollicipes pollicipes TaxID=41117 RepID=UPI00188536EE|nr:nuclear pore complex protein Nup205-like [Pollicipes pollicipes]